MIIHINGFPGVGKLTIGRHLAKLLGAKLLDNHSIYNVALSLTEFKSKEYYDALRSVRRIAYDCIKALPKDTPVILTNAHGGDSAWGNESWDEVISLARESGSELSIVVLECSPEENRRRIQYPDRDEKRKPRDPDRFKGNEQGLKLLDRGGDRLLKLDITSLSAVDAAGEIASWLSSDSSMSGNA